MLEELKMNGEVYRRERLQPPRPKIDELFIGECIEQLWSYTEEDCSGR
jgi:hypothetical protein